MPLAAHYTFADLPIQFRAFLLHIIQAEFQPKLKICSTVEVAEWERVIRLVNPVFFILNDGELLVQIGEQSRHELIKQLRQLSTGKQMTALSMGTVH